MALKLFRSTGFSTLLTPGEARLAPHPGWFVLAASVWLGLACNVALWRELAGSARSTPGAAVALGGAVAGASCIVLSLFGWRRTLKPMATLLLFVGALLACGLWIQSLPMESLWTQRPRTLLPSWASLLRWQVPSLIALLALLPAVVVWHVPVRRLPGPRQLRVNLIGAALGGAVLGLSAYLMR